MSDDVLRSWHEPITSRAAVDAPRWWPIGGEPRSVLRPLRALVEGFRAAGLGPGDRVAVALEPGPLALAVIGAALWEDLTIVLAPPGIDVVALAVAADPALAVAGHGDAFGRSVPWAVVLDGVEGDLGDSDDAQADLAVLAAFAAAVPRVQIGPPSIAARALVRPSQAGPLVALSDANVRVCAQAVVDGLAVGGARWLSTLPWTAADGLVLDVLPALFAAREIVRPGPAQVDGAPDVAAVGAALEADATLTHTVVTVAMARALIEHWGGPGPLAHLHDGLVVGPGVDGELAHHLAKTRLRAARGAAELSGLVTMGEPGLWRAGVAGRAVTCIALPDGAGGLAVTGTALALGTFDQGVLTVLDPARVVTARFT